MDDARGRVLCYVCGQRVLTPASLAPHLKKCERAARAAHRLDASTLLPTRPSVAPPTDPHDTSHIRAWNVAARRAFEASFPNVYTAIEGLRASRRATPTPRASALLIEV